MFWTAPGNFRVIAGKVPLAGQQQALCPFTWGEDHCTFWTTPGNSRIVASQVHWQEGSRPVHLPWWPDVQHGDLYGTLGSSQTGYPLARYGRSYAHLPASLCELWAILGNSGIDSSQLLLVEWPQPHSHSLLVMLVGAVPVDGSQQQGGAVGSPAGAFEWGCTQFLDQV